MADSIRLKILKEIVLRLNTSRPVGVPEFELLRTLPIEAANHPAATVYPAAEPVEPASNRASKASLRTMRAVVEVRVGAVDPLTAADPITNWITETLGGVRLSVLGNPQLTHEILERSSQWKVAQRDAPFLAIFVELEIPYATLVRDQTAQPS